jgi:hypothetical protein
MTKIKKLFAAVFSLGALAISASALAATDASSTLTTIMDSIITTSVSFATLVITNYWPYVIVFGILSAMIGLFMRFAHLGSGRK